MAVYTAEQRLTTFCGVLNQLSVNTEVKSSHVMLTRDLAVLEGVAGLCPVRHVATSRGWARWVEVRPIQSVDKCQFEPLETAGFFALSQRKRSKTGLGPK